MARRKSFQSVMTAVAREHARQQREAERAHAQAARAVQQAIKARDRQAALQAKEDKQRYTAARQQEVDDCNQELAQRWQELGNILQYTLGIDDTIAFDALRVREPYTPTIIPASLTTQAPAPQQADFVNKVKPPTLVEMALRMKGRYQRELQAAEEQYQSAMRAYEQSETERVAKLLELRGQAELSRMSYEAKMQQREEEVTALEEEYRRGEVDAVITYNSMVLERSVYPDGFPQVFRLAYQPEAKELVIDYQLPPTEIVPPEAEFRYVKTKDSIESKLRKPVETRDMYLDVVSSITLRSIHEVLEADQANVLEVVVFNGFVETIDPATGQDIQPYLISTRAVKAEFLKINLARVDKKSCLRNLGARVSPQPTEQQPVKPVVEFNMVDRRFVEQGDVLSSLESRPNLMELSPSEFETLCSNLFNKMGLETRLTRASKDGGVDVVAYDTRPVLGGKVVIQSKRYRNLVDVSAVRDLYGTMVNEGASKGILVTTSNYGPDAYAFSKDKPIELIDGGGLLFLLEQVGIQARIIMPKDG